MDQPLRLLVLGAHPDDAEFHAGALSIEYRRHNYDVKWVSATDGSSGHHLETSDSLRARRKVEFEASAAKLAVEVDIWPFRDGALQADLELRARVIQEIRTWRPDLVLTHRPWDYHPDHRALGQAVQDASYLVTVPLILPEIEPLRRDPVVASMVDLFQRPVPFQPDFILDGSQDLPAVVDLLAAHESQVFEFLPYSFHLSDSMPEDQASRKAWLTKWLTEVGQRRWRHLESFWREAESASGEWLASQPESPVWVEGFEVSEYAAQLPPEQLERLFPGCRPIRHHG